MRVPRPDDKWAVPTLIVWVGVCLTLAYLLILLTLGAVT